MLQASSWNEPDDISVPGDNNDSTSNLQKEAEFVVQQLMEEEKKEEKHSLTLTNQQAHETQDTTSYFDVSAHQGYSSTIISSRGSVEDFLANQRRRVMTHGTIEDPFDWWKDNANRKTYPHIASLAQQWLGIDVIVGENRGQNNCSALDDTDLSDFITTHRPFK
jgi:hypothetical protein